MSRCGRRGEHDRLGDLQRPSERSAAGRVALARSRRVLLKHGERVVSSGPFAVPDAEIPDGRIGPSRESSELTIKLC